MPSGDVFPRRNLPPEAEQWGREVEKRVAGAEQALEVSGQSLSGLNRNTASSLALLAGQISAIQEQQNDLQGRVSYAASDNSLYDSWDVSQPDNAPWGPSLTFSLSRPRVVSVTFMCQVSANALGQSRTQTANSFIYGCLFVNSRKSGPDIWGTSAIANTGHPDFAARDSFYTEVPLNIKTLVTLPAGQHTVQGGFSKRKVQGTGGGSGSVAAASPYIIAEVLQPAD